MQALPSRVCRNIPLPILKASPALCIGPLEGGESERLRERERKLHYASLQVRSLAIAEVEYACLLTDKIMASFPLIRSLYFFLRVSLFA